MVESERHTPLDIVEAERRQRLYETVLSHIPDFVYVFSLDHRVLYANHALVEMWGRGLAGTLGKTFLELGYEPWHAEMHDREIDQVRATRQPVRGEVPFTGTLGRRYYEYIFVPVIGADGQVEAVAGTTRDVTARHEADESRRASEARQSFLIRLADTLRPLFDPIEVQAEASRVLGEYLGANRVLYFEIRGDEYIIERDYISGVQSLAARYPVSAFGPALLESLLNGRTVVEDDATTLSGRSAEEKAAFAAIHLRGHVDVPLVKDGKFVAGMTVHFSDRHDWTAEEIAIIEDTAERTWAAVERARVVEQLREQDRRKDEFLATLAHELRNPLAPLRNGLHLMKLDGASGTIEKARGMMERQLTQLVRLVDDLLDVSRVTSGKLALRKERVTIEAVINAGIETVRPLLDQAGHELSVDLPAEPLVMNADPTRLAQVVSNLLNNSAKYTPSGGRIGISARREGETAMLTVTDTGIGIPPHMLREIFDMFAQVDRRLEKATGGLGIGLSLVKGLVDLHGGTVEARSHGENSGSEFIVRLPLTLGSASN